MKKPNSARGQSLVLIALLMVAIIALLGLVIDGGEAYVSKRNAQNSADAAAFAGARKLASQATAVEISNTIYSFASENRAASLNDVSAYFIDKNGNNICQIPCSGVPTSPLATGVRVTATLRYQPYFIDLIIGSGPIHIPAVAAAQSGPGGMAPVMPMSLPFPCTYNPLDPDACRLDYGRVYTLTGDSQLPGGFQWVDYTGGATVNDIVNYLTRYWSSAPVMADPPDAYVPYTSPQPSPSPWIPSGPGVQPDSKIQCALDAWLNLSLWGSCQHGGGSISWGDKPADNKWIIPVFDVKYGTGNNALYHVVMFGEFEFQGYWFANNQCNYVGAPNNLNCNTGLPSTLQSCATASQKCIMGTYLRDVTNLPPIPGPCNTNGINVCGVGLSQ